MESSLTLSTTSLTISTISKAINRHFSQPPHLLLARRLRCTSRSSASSAFPLASPPPCLRGLYAAVAAPVLRLRFACASAQFGTAPDGGGGGAEGGGGGGEGGGGGGGEDGGVVKSGIAGGGGTEDVSAISADVIILDVGGMSCGGCAASVKRILESQPQVSSASVNLTTETAVVWPVSEAKVVPNWKKQLGEALAKHLTSCGFTSNPRMAGEGAIEDIITP